MAIQIGHKVSIYEIRVLSIDGETATCELTSKTGEKTSVEIPTIFLRPSINMTEDMLVGW